MIRRAFISSACLLVLSCGSSRTPPKTDPSVAPGINARFATEEGRAATLQILEGEGRDQYQKPDEVIRNMALKPGDVVCEIGAGSGYFTPFLSKAVGNAGKVYAQDPQAEFLEVLKKKKTAQGLSNVEVVLGTYTDTNLPDGVCDVTFVADTYHHFEWPKPMLDAMKRDTKPRGRLVIVDFYRRQNAFFDKVKIDAAKHVRLDLDGVIEEVEAHGWKHADTRKFLDYQYFVVFTPR
jgi:ubiquinone/menaquinone biosynthesis C-methylase UbiE